MPCSGNMSKVALPEGAVNREPRSWKIVFVGAQEWLPFVGNYRTFLNGPAVDPALFGAAMPNMNWA
jgi:hypothetical protein